MPAVEFDFSELAKLAGKLSAAPAATQIAVRAVTVKSADRIVKSWRDDVSRGGRTATSYGSHITKEKQGDGFVIGPEKVGTGNMGGILEFGSVNGNAPLGSRDRIAGIEGPLYEKAIEAVVESVL